MIEIVDDGFDFIVMPYIVLVGKEDDIAFAEIDCFLEVGADAEVCFVTMDAEVGVSSFSEAFDDGQGIVGATVIAHHNLVHGQGLAENGFNLFANVGLAVICTQCNRQHFYRI